MDEMFETLRYWRPWRRFLVQVSHRVPWQLAEWILKYLYTDDVYFK